MEMVVVTDNNSEWNTSRCRVCSAAQHRVLAECPCHCWAGPVGVGYARTLACSEFGCVHQTGWPWTDPPGGLTRARARRVQRLQHLHSLRQGGVPGGDDPRTYPSAQCRHRVIHLHFTTSCISCYSPNFLYSCTTCDHIIVWLPYCIYTCMPVSVNYPLMKAVIDCRNVWTSLGCFG